MSPATSPMRTTTMTSKAAATARKLLAARRQARENRDRPWLANSKVAAAVLPAAPATPRRTSPTFEEFMADCAMRGPQSYCSSTPCTSRASSFALPPAEVLPSTSPLRVASPSPPARAMPQALPIRTIPSLPLRPAAPIPSARVRPQTPLPIRLAPGPAFSPAASASPASSANWVVYASTTASHPSRPATPIMGATEPEVESKGSSPNWVTYPSTCPSPAGSPVGVRSVSSPAAAKSYGWEQRPTLNRGAPHVYVPGARATTPWGCALKKRCQFLSEICPCVDQRLFMMYPPISRPHIITQETCHIPGNWYRSYAFDGVSRISFAVKERTSTPTFDDEDLDDDIPASFPGHLHNGPDKPVFDEIDLNPPSPLLFPRGHGSVNALQYYQHIPITPICRPPRPTRIPRPTFKVSARREWIRRK